MKRISFSLTKEQLLDGTKTVTRRLGWKNAKRGDTYLAVSKCMGLKPGERAEVYGTVTVLDVRRESLSAIRLADVSLEGFDLTPSAFVAMFCRAMKCEPNAEVTRIKFAFTARSEAKP